ncbi:MAG: SPOR domain-containing protein [Bacteroidetes bacterium]|nr:SPOR domain-containing protein [Bacteroidota bacterium]
MRILFLFITSLFASQLLFAQATFSDENQEETTQPEILQNLQVNQDPRLDKMLNWHIEKNIKKDGIDGFRVEIFFSSESDALNQARSKKVEFLSEYPDYEVQIKYDAPNFRVRIGNYRTKNEALKLHKKIEKSYPMAFIVPDKIKFPLLKQVNYE